MKELRLPIALVLTFGILGGSICQKGGGATPAMPLTQEEQTMGERIVEAIRGRTIRWTFEDGPMAGMRFEHSFHENGTLVWRALDGAMKGASAQEKEYAAVEVAKDIYAVSYLATFGYTLSVVLNFIDMRMIGFASNDKQWHSMTGTFEILE